MGAAKYSGLNAKISGIYKRYSSDDLDYALEAASYRELTAYYQDFLSLSPRGDNSDLAFSQDVKEVFYNEIKSLEPFVHRSSKEFYENLIKKYTIEDIKRMLRAIIHSQTTGQLVEDFYTGSSFGNTIEGDNLPNFLKELEKAGYGRNLSQYSGQNPSSVFFYLEMTLDRNYYSALLESAQDLSKVDREIATSLIGTEIDLLNLTYILRGLETYNMYPAEIATFLIEGGNKYSYQKLLDLLQLSLSQFKEFLENSAYKELFDRNIEYSLLNQEINSYLFREGRRAFRNSGFTIGKLVGFWYLLNFKSKNISTLIEGKRLGFSPDLIKTYLIE